MYVVIFRAETNELDEQYFEMAATLRELAIARYGCIEFSSVTEGNQETTVSYWPELEHIKQWRQNTEHLAAQLQGRSKWYKNYSVQIAEVIQEYKKS